MLESEKQEPKGYNIPEKWIAVSAFLMAIVYAIIFIVIWPLLSMQSLHAHLLSRAENDYGSLTGPKLLFYPALYSNETHSVARFSTDAFGDCIGMFTILTANGIECATKQKHYYAMGEDRQWVDLYLCSEVPAEGTVSLS
jgi:hypothetical protein